jgi:RHS repeat-associated protein
LLLTALRSSANDSVGLTSPLTDDAGRTTTWKYDKAGLARAFVLPNGQIQEKCRGTEAFWTEAKPEPEGRAARAGAASQNTHDAAGRLSSRALKTAAGVILAAFGWAHDAAGNVTAQSEVWPGSAERAAGTRVTAMTYHDGGWLESESVTEPGQAPRLTLYGYDNAANRTGKTVSENAVVSTATTYAFNPANQLVEWIERNGEGTTLRSATLTFDTRGNRSGQTITQPGAPAKTTSYSWDYQNRLVGVTDPQGGQHAYAYDYRTRRIARSEPGGATAVSWSGGLSLAEYPVSGLQGNVSNATSPTVEYRRGPDMGGGIGGLLHAVRGSTVKYNLGNGRGDIVAQTDQSGTLTWTASYEAFGKRPVETGTNADRQRANTKEEDPTGLLWEHFRYRDLETGVWLSRDPAGFVDGPNLYAYVRQNPWSKFDPWGLEEDDYYDEGVDASLFSGGNFADRQKALATETLGEVPGMVFIEYQHESIPAANETAKQAKESAEQQIEEVKDGIVDATIETASMATDVVPAGAPAKASLGFLVGGGKWIKKYGDWAIGGIKSLFKKAPAAKTTATGAESALQGAQLNRHLTQLEKYGAAGSRTLENGRVRYYGNVDPARTPGEMAGRRLVREWDPSSNATRTWHETVDHAGSVRQVRPETGGPKVHYRFDANGNYIGSW